MKWEDIKRVGDDARVSIAANSDHHWDRSFASGEFLEPELWEALRLEMQRRYRRATGEELAVLTIVNNPEAK
jgi:hypothetical protein